MPLVRSFISPEEVYPGRTVSYDEVAALAGAFNRSASMEFLGFLNLLLSCALAETHLTNKLEPVRDVQSWLFREVVSASLLTDLQAKFGNASLLDRPILHRTQVLFAIRLIATHGQATGGNRLVSRSDFDAIGDLLFLINGLLGVEPAPKGAPAVALWLAAQVGPMHELENPPALELSWPRIQRLLTEFLPASVSNPAELERLEQIGVFSTGFSTAAWIDLSFMLFSYWGNLKFRGLLKERAKAYLDPNKNHEVVSQEALSRAVDVLGIKFENLPDLLRIDSYSRLTFFDVTPFRTKPLWLMPDGLVLCVDAGMLMERLGAHMFWAVSNSLDTEERRRQFSSSWGHAFESYCHERLGEVFRGKKWKLVLNPASVETGNEVFDALVIRDAVAIVVECKGTFVKSVEKYSGRPSSFLRGLSRKFGNADHAAIHQLTRGISQVWFEKGQIEGAKLGEVTEIFPILVAQDPILECGPVARVLSDRFEASIKRKQRKRTEKLPKIWPLTVVTVDALDLLAAAIEASGQRLDALLKRFHRTHPSRMTSLPEFLWSGANKDYGFPEDVNRVVQRRFKAATADVVSRFETGEYRSR